MCVSLSVSALDQAAAGADRRKGTRSGSALHALRSHGGAGGRDHLHLGRPERHRGRLQRAVRLRRL